MKDSEYENIYRNEDDHPWYRHLRELSGFYLERYSRTLPAESSILDAGCGTGGELAYLLAKARFKNSVALDKHPLALECIARRALPISIVRATVDSLPFAGECFHAVLCLDVLYMQGIQVEKALRSFYQCLYKDGVLILNTAALECFRGAHDQMALTARRFTLRGISQRVERAGFVIQKASYWNFFLAPIIFVKRRFRSGKSLEPESDLEQLPKPLIFMLSIIFRIEGFLFKLFDLPIGTSVFIVAKKV